MVQVRLFAGAADAAGTDNCQIEAGTTEELLAQLVATYGRDLARVLPQCSLLVNGVAAVGNTELTSSSRVDVLPPFAGG